MTINAIAKYKTGDKLQMVGGIPGETFTVTAVSPMANPGQYILQSSSPGWEPFALDIGFVDGNPGWRLAGSTFSPWIIAGAAAVGLVLFVMSKKR